MRLGLLTLNALLAVANLTCFVLWGHWYSFVALGINAFGVWFVTEFVYD